MDVPTCYLDERLGQVRERVRKAGWDTCVVVNESKVVLGLLRAKELDQSPELRVEQAMRPGPSTFRPHVPVAEMAQYMIEHDMVSAPITTSDGRLIGLLRRDDAVKASDESPESRRAGGEGEA
jgi:CBS domain-containing protein